MTTSVPLRAIVAALAIHALWGGNPVAVKFGLLVFPPMWSAFFRFALAIACVVLWARFKRIPLRPQREEWPVLAGIGALFTLQIAAMNLGFDRTTGAMGSVLIATNPIFAVVFAHFVVAGDRLSVAKSAGLAIAFAGTCAVLLADASLVDLRFGSAGNWIVLSSACLLGLRLSLSARVLRRIHEVRVVVWQMLLSLPVFAAGGLLFETIHWERLDWPPIAGIAYQGIVIASLGFVVSFHLMRRYTPSVMMSFNFVSPVAGVLLSAWLLSDRVGPNVLLGMALVALGLSLIARRPATTAVAPTTAVPAVAPDDARR